MADIKAFLHRQPSFHDANTATAALPDASTAAPAAPRKTVLPVEIQPAQLRPLAFRVFSKKHNFSLRSDALALLTEYVGRKCGATWKTDAEELLLEVARTFGRMEQGKTMVDGDALRGVLNVLDVPHAARNASLQRASSFRTDANGDIEMSHAGAVKLDISNYFRVISSHAQPKYVYDRARKHFDRSRKPPSLFGSAESKGSLFRERFGVLRLRLYNNDTFREPQLSSQSSTRGGDNWLKITSIKNLLGRTGQSFLVFGMLTLGPDGAYWLEDLDSRVKLDISQTMPGEGWFFPGCFVLVDGRFGERDVFKVLFISHPPSERRNKTMELLPHFDHLETGHERDLENDMRKAEVENDIKFVILRDVHLDRWQTLDALRACFQSYVEPPHAFILMGNFISSPPHLQGSSSTIKAQYDALASLLEEFPELCSKSRFIFVPGDFDPWASSFAGGASTIIPRLGLPDVLTSRIRRLCKDFAIMTSNPCRISYFTHEIVIFRDDLLGRLQRNSVLFPLQDHNEHQENADPLGAPPQSGEEPASTPQVSTDIQTARRLVRTVLDQAHLSPFPLNTRPVYWEYDYALRLYPLPTMIVLADGDAPVYDVTYEGCHVMNPSQLVDRNKARWVEYIPSIRKGVRKESSF